MKTLNQLQVLIACPGDVATEKQAVREVIEKFNKITGQALGVRCEPTDWENNSYPSMGQDGQDVLNQQIVSDADIFIGIMWSKIGSPTSRAASGTIEEYEQILEKWKVDTHAIEIMWYFKTDPIPQNLLVDANFASVGELKQKLSDDGVYYSQVSGKEFRDKFEDHFTSAITEYLARLRKKKEGVGTSSETVSSGSSVSSDTQIIRADTEDTVQLGVFDYAVVFESSIEALTGTSRTISDSTEEFGNEMVQLANSLNSKDPSDIKLKEAKSFLDKGANLLEAYSDSLDPNIEKLKTELHNMFTSMSGLFVSIADDNDLDKGTLESARESLVELDDGIASAQEGICELKNGLESLPGLTYNMMVAKQRLSGLLNLLLDEFGYGRSRIKSIIASGLMLDT